MQTYSTEEWKFILEFEVKRNGEGLWGQIFVDNLGEIRSMIYEHHFDKWLPSLCEADEKLSSTKCYEWSLNAMVTVFEIDGYMGRSYALKMIWILEMIPSRFKDAGC